MALTKAQQAAVDLRDRTLLVSAAAGSGKTFSLTKRIIKTIIEDGRDISRLLIVTFTKAAAGELRVKISKAISEAIAEHPENTHLQSQLIKLGNAHISTIDSFFSRPVRANFEKLGLPASIRLADEGELCEVRERAMSETLNAFFEDRSAFSEKKLSSVGYSDRYTELLGIISNARDSSDLIPTLTDIYKKLMTSPEGISALRAHSDRLSDNSKAEFFQTYEGRAVLHELYSTSRYAYDTLSRCCDDLAADEFLSVKYLPSFEEVRLLLIPILDALEKEDYDEARVAFNAFAPKAITRLKPDEKSELSEYYKELRGSLRDTVKEVGKTYLSRSKSELASLFSILSDMNSLLFDILTEFDRRYTAEKLRRGVCEFSDMPRFVLSLLRDKDGQPTEYARTLSASFDEVYIDEYQDVNEIQDLIFASIGNSHRFMVGDIKQSIYGFREAEPTIFADYRRKFPIYDKDNDVPPEGGGGNTVFMSENFRCDESIVRFTNAVCSRVFSAFSESIGYTSDDDLKFAKALPYDGYESPKVILDVIQKPEDDGASDDENTDDEENDYILKKSGSINDEAIVVANEIAQLLLHGKNADGTPIRPCDIAVLVRSNSTSRYLTNALSKLNISYALSSKGELFEGDDMRLIVDLLSVIDNPRSDIPLCHVLSAESESYESFFSLEEIISIRRAADKSKSLFDAAINYADAGEDKDIALRCREFVSLIEKMRASAYKLSADKFLKSLISSERFAPLTESDAFTYIYDSACRYVSNNWGGLYSFLKYFKGIIENGESGAEPQKKNTDAVTVMTIHQSKGLEFNVCFLFGFGKQFNFRSRHALSYDRKYGASMKLPPLERSGDIIECIKVRFEDDPIQKIDARLNKLKQIEEEARILYVAMTRARERLYISATLRTSCKDALKKASCASDLSYEVKKGSSYIDWILLALSNDPEVSDVYSINIFTKGEPVLEPPITSTVSVHNATNISDREREYASLLSSPQSERAEERILSTIPSKAAASKASSHMLDDSAFIPIPVGKLFSDGEEQQSDGSNEDRKKILSRIELMRAAPPSFESLLEVNKKPTGAEVGTAAHLFLQYCNYKNVEENGLDAEIDRLEAERFITHRTASIINRLQLSGFFKSELYSHIRSAAHVRREFRFGMFLPAANFTENEELREIVKNKNIFVQGSIDIIIETASGELIICDYKTDRISAEERADRKLLIKSMKERHGEQIKQYRTAVERIFGKTPEKIFIYSLALGDTIEM